MKWFICILACGVILSGIDCAQWAPSPEDGQGLYVCAGTTLTIPWQLNLNSGETIKEVQWYFRGQSEEVIALKVHGQFLPMATFSQRVTSHLNAGIQLDHVTTGDSGAFSVEVTTLDSSGALSSLRHTVHVYVAGDGLMTTDGTLDVQLQPSPVFDNSSNSWKLKLTCGNFLYTSNPPFDVVWMVPGGQRKQSSRYEASTFQLLLSAPVAGGNYTCQIPDTAAEDVCVEASVANSVTVDGMIARLSLLEANQMSLAADNAQLQSRNNFLETRTAQLEDQLRLQSAEISDIRGILGRQVSFLATPQQDIGRTGTGTKLVFRHVSNNLGNAYNASSGIFVAPYSGNYFFAVSTRCAGGVVADTNIMSSSGEVLCSIDSGILNDAGSCQIVARLAHADSVWIQSHDGPTCYRADSSRFTGFLINVDP